MIKKILPTVFWKFTALFFVGVSIFLLNRPGFEGDTMALIDYVFSTKKCIMSAQWTSCPNVGSFPLFQYIPSLILALLGGSNPAIAHLLSYLSYLCFLLTFWVFFKGLKTLDSAESPLSWLGVLILLSGYNLRYSNLSFGEMSASFFILLFVISILKNHVTWKICTPLLIAGITKETAFPFLFGFGLISLFVAEEKGLQKRHETKKKIFWISCTLGVSLALNTAFNIFRFGSALNLGYLSRANIVPDLWRQMSYCLAAWFSPTGGIAFYWTSGFLLLFGVGSLQWQWPLRKRFPYWGVLSLLLLLSFGFAKWYTPLGGYAWGDRLMLPWLPASFFILLWTYATEITAGLKKWSHNTVGVWITAVALGVSAFPQFAILFRHSLISRVFEQTGCLPDPELFNRIDCSFWPPKWPLLTFFNPYPRPDLFCLALFCCILLGAIIFRIRRGLLIEN